MNEADTRYHLIDPVLRDKGYVSRERITLETILTPAPVEPSGARGLRRKGLGRTDYLLCVQVGDMPKAFPVAVNPTAVVEVDTRTPQRIIENIEAQGRIVADALARLNVLMTTSETSE